MAYRSNVNILAPYYRAVLGSLKYIVVAILNITCMPISVMQHFSQDEDNFTPQKN